MIAVLSMQGHRKLSVESVCRASHGFSGSALRDVGIYSQYLSQIPNLLKVVAAGSEDEIQYAVSEAIESNHAVQFVECLISTLCDILKTHYDSPNEIASLSNSGEIEKLTESWTDEVCIAACAKLSDVLRSDNSSLNLKIGPRLNAAVSWMCVYVSQASAKKKSKVSK
jgi:hypothetical protein